MQNNVLQIMKGNAFQITNALRSNHGDSQIITYCGNITIMQNNVLQIMKGNAFQIMNALRSNHGDSQIIT